MILEVDLRILLGPDTQLDAELVWEHFGVRDPWDLISSDKGVRLSYVISLRPNQ